MNQYNKHRDLTDEDVEMLWRKGWVEGDEESKRSLIDNYTSLILLYIGHRMPHKYDRMHDVIVYLYDKLYDFNPNKGNIISYIRQACRNVKSRRARYSKVEQGSVELKHARISKRCTPDNPFSIMDNRERKDTLGLAVKDVILEVGAEDEKAAQVLIDRYLKGMQLQEVARAMGVVNSCVTYYTNKGIKIARRVMEGYEDDLR